MLRPCDTQKSVRHTLVRPIELAEMTRTRDNPQNNFTPAQEAIGNLLLPKLKGIFSGGWTEALDAHTKIGSASTSHKSSVFYWHYLPLLKNLVSVLADSFRQYFKLALAHPRQTRRDPHLWAWDQLQPAVRASLEWIRDWFILACDGENRFVRRMASTEYTPGQTVSLPIPTTVTRFPQPESWRAPAWLFQVSLAHFGVGLLKTEHVPARDSEERLGAAHTRLLLKGARRVFLRELRTAIETVWNEELAAAGAIPTGQVSVERSESKARQPKGFDGLGPKKTDLSRYMHNMTEKQQLAFSLKYEYALGLAKIASRMELDRKTAYEHIKAAEAKVNQAFSSEKRKVNRAKSRLEE
jgi:predicted DNA-binding protein (UPF0251 family)